jgi:hypothetical protein
MCDQAKSKCTADCAPGYCPAADGTLQATSESCAASCNVDMSSCEASAKTACDADPTCAAATKCYTNAKCDSLPDGPDESSGSSSDSTDDGTSTSSGDGN